MPEPRREEHAAGQAEPPLESEAEVVVLDHDADRVQDEAGGGGVQPVVRERPRGRQHVGQLGVRRRQAHQDDDR
ncbi:hypothetical protein LUX57_16940 [Actinomadura madurae]|uniref:hypothetical protein n=1 Tax=Actinomadura madurae TaxID=1993 RepID=UPI0020D20142|nr:hypothetical protein [Actinomadura madurae]MCP9966576.1 hypothetical protein [Actinomadura madurae]